MRIALAAAAAALLALPGSASAAVECGVVDREVQISTTAFADGVAIVREGDQIAVTDDRTGLPVSCAGGPPAVSSVDAIELRTEQEETSLYVDLAKGSIPPLEISWVNGSFGIGGTRQEDVLEFGNLSGSLVSVPESDLEVAATGTGNMLIRGGKGDDKIDFSAYHDPGFAPAKVFASILAGPGDDRVGGGTKPDIIECGGGFDKVVADKRDTVSKCEK